MKLNRIPILLLFPLIFCLSGFTNLNTNSDQPVLIRIEIQNVNDPSRLAEIPLSVYLRTDDHVIATIEPDRLSLLEDAGFNFKIIDKQAWSKPYFLINRHADLPIKTIPSIGETIDQIDAGTIVKVPADATNEFRDSGFQTVKIPELPLPLQAIHRKTLHDFQIERLRHPVIGAIIQRVSDSFIRAGVQRLEDFQTRFSDSDSVYAAGQWIYDEFKRYGYKDVKFDTLSQPVLGRLQRNVIATKRGTTYPDSIIVIGGHYDSVVYDGTDTRIYAPGADDNATGTIAALEAARILADFDLEATVVFAAWAAEEQGLYGGWDFARKAFDQKLNIAAYLNFDMIGNLIEADPLRDVTFYINSASEGLAELMKEMALTYTTLEPRYASASGGSDHWPFLQMGFLSVGTEEGDFSPHWHRRTDVIDNVNIPYTNEVIRMGLATLLHLAGPPAEISGSYITYNTIKMDDDKSGRSVGNANNFLDPGETIEVGISLKNAGNVSAQGISATLHSDDPYVAIIDSSRFYGNIAPGDSTVIPAPFVFSVSPQTPNNRSVIFSIDVRDSQGQSWESRFLFKITQPLLVYNTSTIDDVTGDHDQIPDIGETCNLSIHLGNYGARPANQVKATLSTYDPDIAIVDNLASIPYISKESIASSSNDPLVIQIKASALPHKVKFKLAIEEGDGYYRMTEEFSILLEQGRVLLVIDDGQANRSNYYTEILDEFGVPTDAWRVATQGPVPHDTMLRYKNIIWFTGTEAINTLTSDDQENLKAFLNNGGHLLLSGQMLGFNIKDSAFFANYVQAKFINLRSGLHHLKSTFQNVVTSLDSIALAASGTTLQSFTSESDPIAPAFPIYSYNRKTAEGAGTVRSSGTAMHAVDNGTYKLIYCGFGLEGIIPDDARKTILADILGWFKGSALDTRAILSVADFSYDDDSINPSQGDGDGYLNPGETIELNVDLKNSGNLTANDVTAVLRTTSPLVTILDSTKTYGKISSGSTASTAAAFTFIVHSAAPHQSPVEFDFIIFDSTGNRWDETLTATINLSNTITGQICDIGTGTGIAGAHLYWGGPIDESGQPAAQGDVSADASGHYRFSGPIGLYAFQAWKQGYIITDLVFVELPPDTTLNFQLTCPQIAVAPDSITMNLNAGETVADTLTIRNSNTGQLYYSLLESGPNLIKATTTTMPTIGKPMSWRFDGIPKVTASSSNQENSAAPDPALWKLMHVDPNEPNVDLDIHETYIQNTNQDIFFKINTHQTWGNPATDFLFAIFIDIDRNFMTGAQFNDIGAEYVIGLGNIGNAIFAWSGNGWNPAPGNNTPHFLQLSANSDSLEVGIHLSQIGNPKRFNLVCAFLGDNQTGSDIAPDNGLFHIPYSTYDASWLAESSFYGAIPAGESNDIILTFNTKGLSAGSYLAHVEIANNQPDGESKIIPVRLNVGGSSVADGSEEALPEKYALHPNFPNPFNPETLIKYQLPEAGEVKLEIYNLMGQKIKTLVHESKKAGYHQAIWNGKIQNGDRAASGVYFYRLESGGFMAIRKMLLIQ